MSIPSTSRRPSLCSGVVEERETPLRPAASALDRPRRQEEQDYGEWPDRGGLRGLVEDCTENHACAQALCLHAGRPGRETQNRLQNFDWSTPILLFWLSFGHFTFVLKMEVEWVMLPVI